MAELHKIDKTGMVINIILSLFCFIIAFYFLIILLTPPKIIPTYDAYLSPKVNTFLESVDRVSETSRIYTNNIPRIDCVKKYCVSFIYGYTENYVFAHATCNEYGWYYRYHTIDFNENGERYPLFSSPIKITRELYNGARWSSYIRLSYKPNTDFEFTSYELPEPGVNYYKSTTEMFQMQNIGLPLSKDEEEAGRDLEARFHIENDDTPLPHHIDEIYGIKNPQIVY